MPNDMLGKIVFVSLFLFLQCLLAYGVGRLIMFLFCMLTKA
jgi:hypothetical protein